MHSVINEQATLAQKGEVTPVIVVTSDQPLVTPVSIPDVDFYRVKDKSCKDLDTEHNTPSHSPVVSRHNSFIHKARLRKESVTESVESKGQSEPAADTDVDAERKRKRESEAHDDEPQRKVRKIDDATDSVKDNER